MLTIRVTNDTAVWSPNIVGNTDGWMSDIFTGNQILERGALNPRHQGGLSGGNVPAYFGWSTKNIGGNNNYAYRVIVRVPGHDWNLLGSQAEYSQQKTLEHAADEDPTLSSFHTGDELKFVIMREVEYAFLVHEINGVTLTAANLADDTGVEFKVFI